LRAIGEAAAGSQSVRDACEQVLAAATHHRSDIPFALAYVCDIEAGVARLAAASALEGAMGARPEVIDLRGSADALAWPVAKALTANEIVVIDDVIERFGALPGGDWPFAPRCAAIAPVTPPGRNAPEAVLVVGVSARHLFDAPYRTFLELVVQQLGAAIAGGRVHEDEQRRARARARRRSRTRAIKAHFAGVLEERTRLSREIHDTLLQGVTGIALQLCALLPRMQTSPESAAQSLADIVELAEKTSREAREAVWDLRPASLNEQDLAKTLDVAARRVTAGTPIALRVAVTGEARRFPATRHTAIVRVVQEAVANAVRHAVPRTIRVRLTFGPRRLRVVVADDGRGFVVRDDFRSYSGHFGLLGMRERAVAAGGALHVRSAAGQGTTVTLILPHAVQSAR
jgi:signal transduction histidine kinase